MAEDKVLEKLMQSFNPEWGLSEVQFKSIGILANTLNQGELPPNKDLVTFLVTLIANPEVSTLLENAFEKMHEQISADASFFAAYDLIRDICFYTRFEAQAWQDFNDFAADEKKVVMLKEYAANHNFALLALQLERISESIFNQHPDLQKLYKKTQESAEFIKEIDKKIADAFTNQRDHPSFFSHSSSIIKYFEVLEKVLAEQKEIVKPRLK